VDHGAALDARHSQDHHRAEEQGRRALRPCRQCHQSRSSPQDFGPHTGVAERAIGESRGGKAEAGIAEGGEGGDGGGAGAARVPQGAPQLEC